MTIPTRTATRVVIQTASSWPSTDAGWTTQSTWRVDLVEEGSGIYLGKAQFSKDSGLVRLPGGTGHPTLVAPQTQFVGSYVRVIEEDASGPISDDGSTWSAIWHGVVTGFTEQPDGAVEDVGGRLTYQAAGLAAILGEITVGRGWESSQMVAGWVDPGEFPTCNPGGRGNRTATRDHTVNGESTYGHKRPGLGNEWRARDVLELLLAYASDPAGELPPNFAGTTSLTWSMAGEIGALDYQPADLDIHGRTVLDVLNYLVNPRRALTWSLAVSGTSATVTIHTTARSAISVGSYTLPASTTTATLDYDGPTWLSDLSLTPDHSRVADYIEVVGQRPRVTITLDWQPGGSGALEDGWSPTISAWENAEKDRDSGEMAAVYRKFLLKTGWIGSQYDASGVGLRGHRAYTTGSSAEYGTGGYTGERSHLDGGSPANVPGSGALLAERSLAVPSGEDLTAGNLSWRDEGEADPIVVARFGAGDYQDVSADLAVTIDRAPVAVWLGGGWRDAVTVADWVNAGLTHLLFTVSLREMHPLLVSWARPQAQWPRDVPRIRRIATQHRQDVLLEQTVVGVSADGTSLQRPSATTVFRDGVPAMREMLALARRFYTEPSWQVSWTDRGRIERGSIYAPGVLLTTVDMGTAMGLDSTREVDAVITRRRWVHQGDGTWDTEYQASGAVPDLEALT